MITVIVQHEVKNFTKWKKIFDADKPNRTEHEIKDQGLYTSIKNPNDVTIILEAPDVGTFDKFMANPDLGKTMEEAGVISEPAASLLTKIV